MRNFAEQAMVAVAMAFSVLSGGIDLSVGSVFAMANFLALYLYLILGLPLPVMIVLVIVFGALMGAINGGLIAYGKTRPFLTTLVVLIILRATYNKTTAAFTDQLANIDSGSFVWDFMGSGKILGVPTNMVALIVLAIATHFFLTRVKPGVHIMAVGSSRKAARHAGVNVKRALFSAYVISGSISALAGVFYAARQNSSGTDTGVGWEINALAAVVLGGISLAGGRGTIARAVMGSAIIFMLISGLVRTGASGNLTTAVIGIVLLAAVGFNVKWVKNKGKVLQKVYVTPSWVDFEPPPSIARDGGTVFAENDRLKNAEAIALNKIEGPEDVILDRQDNLYTVNRNGSIIRFLAPDYTVREEFARIGGRPLGLAFDKDQNLLVCIAGMGVYGVRPDRSVFKVTDRTTRTRTRLKDDSRLYLADDLDVAPDGKIYFSEASTRYELTDWALDGFEGRGNGRLVCHDPKTGVTKTILKNLTFPNGVCISHDGKSVLWASTWLCQINRYWIEGPKAGTSELLDRQSAGLLRQHQPRLGRQVLAGFRRTPLARLRPRDEKPELPHAHGQADPARRMAVSRNQLRLRDQVRRQRRGHGIAVGSGRPVASDHHFGSRAQGLPLYRRSREQPNRPHSPARRGPDLGSSQVLLGSGTKPCPLSATSSTACSFPNREIHVIPVLDGAFSPNQRLDRARQLGARSSDRMTLRLGPDGALYVSTEHRILRCSGADFEGRKVFAELGRSGRRPCLDEGRPAARLRLEAGARRAFAIGRAAKPGSKSAGGETDCLSAIRNGRA